MSKAKELLKDIKVNDSLNASQLENVIEVIDEQNNGLFKSKMNKHLCKLSVNGDVLDDIAIKKNSIKILKEVIRVENEEANKTKH